MLKAVLEATFCVCAPSLSLSLSTAEIGKETENKIKLLDSIILPLTSYSPFYIRVGTAYVLLAYTMNLLIADISCWFMIILMKCSPAPPNIKDV